MKEKKWTDLGCKLNAICHQWKDHNYIFLASLHVFWTTKLQIQNSLKVYLFQFFLKSSYLTPLRPTNLNLKKIIFDIVTMICSISGSFFFNLLKTFPFPTLLVGFLKSLQNQVQCRLTQFPSGKNRILLNKPAFHLIPWILLSTQWQPLNHLLWVQTWQRW